MNEKVEPDEPSTPLLKLAVQQMDEYFEGKRKELDFLRRQQGSGFQQQV